MWPQERRASPESLSVFDCTWAWQVLSAALGNETTWFSAVLRICLCCSDRFVLPYLSPALLPLSVTITKQSPSSPQQSAVLSSVSRFFHCMIFVSSNWNKSYNCRVNFCSWNVRSATCACLNTRYLSVCSESIQYTADMRRAYSILLLSYRCYSIAAVPFFLFFVLLGCQREFRSSKFIQSSGIWYNLDERAAGRIWMFGTKKKKHRSHTHAGTYKHRHATILLSDLIFSIYVCQCTSVGKYKPHYSLLLLLRLGLRHAL